MFVTEVIDHGTETATVHLINETGDIVATGSGFCISDARRHAHDDLTRQLDHDDAA